jgi:hypothetical protein
MKKTKFGKLIFATLPDTCGNRDKIYDNDNGFIITTKREFKKHGCSPIGEYVVENVEYKDIEKLTLSFYKNESFSGNVKCSFIVADKTVNFIVSYSMIGYILFDKIKSKNPRVLLDDKEFLSDMMEINRYLNEDRNITGQREDDFDLSNVAKKQPEKVGNCKRLWNICRLLVK